MNTHDAWEKIHQNKDWGFYPSEHIVRFIARNYYGCDRNYTRILDFGCGAGAHTWYLAREGFDTYTFDISETAVKKVISILDQEGLTADVRVRDGLYLDYDNNFFDAVIDNVSIFSNRIEEIRKMYHHIYDMLKINGQIITVVFNRDTTGYGTGTEIEPGTFDNLECGNIQKLGCRHFFEKDELEDILTDIGFKDINIDFITMSDKGNIIGQYIATGVKR